jgi:hypothetical protein
MPTNVRIIAKDHILDAELFETQCAKAIAEILPIEKRSNEWGDELYFEIPVKMPLDGTATTSVKAGDIGFWPPGNALAIFFGPTPASSGSDPVPVSAVNLVGRIFSDATVLKKSKGARNIRIEKA